jgi:hypothetical protein
MSSTTNDTAVNLGVLCGPCSAPPELRVLESGTRLATLAIRCPAGAAGDERATSVPRDRLGPARLDRHRRGR